MKNEEMETMYVECMCEDQSHTLRFSQIGEDVCVSMHLTMFGFCVRLWNALKYIFGHRSKFGDFEETILERKDIKKIVGFLKNV